MRHAVIALAVAVVGCMQPSSGSPIEQSRVETFELPGQAPPKLDLLIVLDNTAAMAPYALRVDAMVRAIDGLWPVGPLQQPDLHVAVAAADPAARGHVRQAGDVAGAFLVDIQRPDWSRERNYLHTLGDALSNLSAVGTDGSASEPLAAIEPALETPGFVRGDATLGIVIVSASDDGSGIDPAALAAALRASKPDPSDVALGLVAPAGAVRLHALAERFANRSATAALGAATYVPALDIIKEWMTIDFGVPCLDEPADVNPSAGVAYDCSVEIVQSDGVVRPVPACPAEDCWIYAPEPVDCPEGPAGLITLPAYGWPLPSLLRGQCVVGK